MIFQALAPSTEVFAQELDAVMEASVSAARAGGNTARSVQDAVASALQDADQTTSDDTATTPGADAGATEGGDGSTNAGESQDSTTDGATSGDAPAEGDASQDDAAADEGAADEEQADDADADAAAQADGEYPIANVEGLKKVLGEDRVTVDENGTVTDISFDKDADLVAISNTDPAVYESAKMTSKLTGNPYDLCGEKEVAKLGKLTFRGFGSVEHPFEGSYDLGSKELTIDRTLFNAINLTEANKDVSLIWKGSDAQPIVAAKVLGNGYELNANITVATDSAELKSPLLGEVVGDMSLKATYSVQGGGALKVAIEASSGNVGLLVNTLAESASLSIGELGGTSFAASTIKTTAEGCNAGGLIGECASGSTVTIGKAIDLSAFSVIGKAAGGGLIGKATNLTLNIADGVTVKPACNVGDKDSACSGGVIGDVSFARKFTVKPNMFDLGDGVTLSATQRAGALFGVADISADDIVVQGGTYKSKLTLPENVSVNGSYGGLVGKVFATTKGVDEVRAFVVQKDPNQKDENQNRCTIEFNLAGGMSDAGGAVGYVGDSTLSNSQPVAVVLDGVTVACKGDASARTDAGKLGGAVGVVDKRNVLDVRDFTLTSDNAIGGTSKNRAAGIAGSARNAVIKFSGITDLSGASFAENSTTGQLVYENNNALIFAVGNGSNADKGAAGWTFKRSNTASKTDDIATYGEVIRLGNDFIKLDAGTHQLTLPDSLKAANGVYTLTSVKDFAKLAITWQTNGYYSMVDDVTENNLNGLKSSTITVNGAIDLKGTGLTGFTQDRADGSQVFSGTLNGNGTNGNGKISLAVGEPYGKRGEAVLDGNDTSNGNGKIYRHGRLGLFAAVNGATISNVTIAGSMKFDNQSNVDAGALAGVKVGGDMSLTSATFCAGIEYESTNKDNYVHVGGVFGSMSGAGSLKIDNRESPSSIKANIVSKAPESGVTCVGGAVGYVASDCIPSAVGKTVEVGGLNVSGSITINDGSAKTYAGGFIGQIAQGGVNGKGALISVKKVEITKLDFASFSLATTGSKTSSSGGFLGYSWAGTEVTLGRDSVNTNKNSYAITTNGSSVKSTYARELGGLVYAASGHWIVNDYAIDLSGATINAGNATTLGLLVGRGSRVAAGVYGSESYAGLYLEDRAYWGTAYKVEGVAVEAAKNIEKFDEWVGDGRKPGSKLVDGEWNTVVSLHTKDDVNEGKLDMSGKPGSDNSYHNRSVFGNNHNTNAWTRYYYNLDKAYAAVGNNKKNSSASSWMDSPEYLLLWCAYLYAPPAARVYIIPGNQAIFQGNNIGTSDDAGVAINLDGYSFYPTNPASGSTVTVNNATITFHYSDIKAEQEGNKKNSEATQHENMHCALIRTHAGNLKVKNVTLAGTVGSVVYDAGSSSGALVCRYIYGPINKTNVAQLEIDGLTLDGLTVDGVNGNTSYAPLLINEMQTCVNLSAKNISTTGYANGMTAATSLFGKLGVGKDADQVTATFNRISVPSAAGQDVTDKSIFTRASLLESFGYGEGKTGSAAYTFSRDDRDKNKVTFGREIDSTDGEYPDKQLWYYDAETYGTEKGFVKVKDEMSDAPRPWFSGYLPYVAKRKINENGVQYHEIMVNQRISNLTTGCGTYGDPYVITSASELNAAARYINNGTALDGWEVTIAKKQSALCQRRNGGSTENEVTYVYKQANGATNKWEKKADNATGPNDVLSDDTMRRYLQSAYYSIEPVNDNKITLDAASFGGFGNKANPFRGVIVGDPKSSEPVTIEIKNNKGELRGLIPYSYGSVVRNLNINYVNAQATVATITYSPKDAGGVPTAFFGGVIGCILGGDNIIDGVVVNNPNNGSTTYGFTVKGSSYLVPIGGYVGAIAGGGVIFRHMNERENPSWRAATRDKSRDPGKGNFGLYDNPYVGRVIDGYAFSEDCTVAVDNGDANYKINKLENKDVPCVTATAASDGTAAQVTPTSAQGLLVLSAIINSGAASGGVSLAYEGSARDTKTSYKFGNERYGKARNATYEHVGNPDVAGEDFKRSTADDQTAPGSAADGSNSPYLVNSYANAATGSLCASSGIELQLTLNEKYDKYDMTSYGRGFTGLSGRYVSNACASSRGINRDCIVPRIACINGNGETVTVGSKKDGKVYGVKEYADDDYRVAGVGALFSTVSFTSKSASGNTATDMVTNLKFQDCDVELMTVDATGGTVDGQVRDEVGVGLLAGVTANNDGRVSGEYRKVTMNGCKVAGAKNVGGLLGSSGYCSRSTATNSTSMVNESLSPRNAEVSPVKLYDCSYSNMDVTGGYNVGGYVGKVGMNSGCGIWKTEADETAVASESSIKATGSGGTGICVGGVFGWTQCNISVNTKPETNTVETTGVAKISNVTVESPISNLGKLPGAGGFIGRADYGKNSIYNLSITATEKERYIGSDAADSSSLNNIGGCIGYIISGNGSSYWFDGCAVNGLHIAAGGKWTGGIIGNFTSNDPISCNNITVDGLKFDSQCAGGLFGLVDRVINVSITNSKIASSAFLRASSGCISGESRGKYHLANVLLDSSTFNNKDQQGILIGSVDTGKLDGYELCAAGLSVKLAEGQTNAAMPALIRASDSSKIGKVNNKSYVAFGDYYDMLTVPNKALYNADAADSTTAAVAPYVTTSPVPENALSVKTASGETGQTRYLFGDGVNVYDDGVNDPSASTIKTDAENGGGTHYAYTNYDGGDHWNYSPSAAGKFNTNNDTDETKTDANPDVLVLSGNDSDTVKDYLNLVTNGGYSDALRLNADGSHVSATVDVFKLEGGVFVKQTDVADRALDVKGSGSSLSISANSNWDNGKGRFNLLTVTFTEAGQSYRVMVPIIVRRVFEIDFTATYSEGANFNKDDYRTKYTKHVLVGSGDVMTGYLTWTYNSKLGEPTEYGWDTYLANGGVMGPLEKTVTFGATLPKGTQLTLVDTAHNNKEYSYTVGEGGISKIKLTDFVDPKDNSNKPAHYVEQWLSETMGVSETPNNKDGDWHKLTKDELNSGGSKTANVKIDGDYYRKKNDEDSGDFYSITAPETSKSENFYLVVRTPKDSSTVNGSTQTEITTSINKNINYKLRTGGVDINQGVDSPSTYSVSSNYEHKLVDNKRKVDGGDNIAEMNSADVTHSLNMDVSDTISFKNDQVYGSSDKLYYQLDSSLVNYEGGVAAGAHGYPTGTQGTYSFYVKVGDNYYTWDDSGWSDAGTTETPVINDKNWTATWSATGGDMSLVLADTSGKAINLSGIREKAREHGNKFTITMRANLTMTEPACQAGIIASQNSGNDKYTKPNYRAHLSTSDDTLSTSSNSAYNDGGAGYYRMDVGSSTIALEASKKSQLGINIDDLKSANGEIDLVGTYDLSKLAGAEAMISSATTVTYTLSLQQRQDKGKDTEKGKYAEVSDISEYIKVDSLSDGGNTWHDNGNSYIFTDSKGTDGKFATRDENRPVFTRAFRVKVNTDVEGKGQTYANYRLVLTAHMFGGTVNDTPVNVSNLDGYSHSDYVTYTLSRINTKGIPHGTKTN